MKLSELAKQIKQPKVGDIVLEENSKAPFGLVTSVEQNGLIATWFETLELLKRNRKKDRYMVIGLTRFEDVKVI